MEQQEKQKPVQGGQSDLKRLVRRFWMGQPYDKYWYVRPIIKGVLVALFLGLIGLNMTQVLWWFGCITLNILVNI